MREFNGKTALITGAANGFGAEFAREAARRGMKLFLVDIERAELDAVLDEVKALGAEAVGMQADVSLYEDVQKYTQAALDTFGSIDLLMNNAGVFVQGAIWEMPVNDVRWMVETDLMSLVYGMREAIPQMLQQGTRCHIVNVCSIAGFITTPFMPGYHAAKFGAVGVSEATFEELQRREANIGMTIFCPGFVQTDLHNSERHRPARFDTPNDPYYKSEACKKNRQLSERFITTGQPNEGYAQKVFQAVEEDRFYLLTEDVNTPYLIQRNRNVEEQKNF